MIIRLPKERAATLVEALRSGREREIGGILMGEHVGINDFRITELTIQRRRGTIARFVRLVEHAVVALQRFFRETRSDYTRFNYLGEWHSHPLFLPQPSSDDDAAMMAIVTDEQVGANFVVLLVAKLVDGQLKATASVYTRSGREQATLMLEEGTFLADQSHSGQSDVSRHIDSSSALGSSRSCGEPLERLERAQYKCRLHLASEKDITTVNDEIHLSAKRRLERALEPGEEARQTQMCVCDIWWPERQQPLGPPKANDSLTADVLRSYIAFIYPPGASAKGCEAARKGGFCVSRQESAAVSEEGAPGRTP